MEAPSQPDSPRSSPPAELEADYYLRNFKTILNSVLERDAALFSSEEMTVFSAMEALPELQLRLYVRLFNRRGPYFRLKGLSYSEIPALEEVAGVLAVSGFARVFSDYQPEIEVSELLAAYTVPELRPLAKDMGIQARARAELVQALLKQPPEDYVPALLDLGPVIRLERLDLFARIQRLFFLNGHQDSTAFVTADLQRIRYPSYRIWRTRPVFPDRSAFEAYLEAQAMRDQFYRTLEKGDVLEAVWLGQEAYSAFLNSRAEPPDFLSRYSARAVFGKTALRTLQATEKAIGKEAAAEMYQELLRSGLPGPYRGEAWARLALVLEKTAGAESSIRACTEGLAEPSTRRGDRLALEKRLDRLERRLERQRKKGKGAKNGKGGSKSESSDTGIDSSKSRTGEPGCGCELGGRTSDGASQDGKKRGLKSARTPEPGPVREVVVNRPLLTATSARGRALFAGADGEPKTVEALALEAYRAAGADGLYTENTFFSTLTGILCWDIIFAEVPDVFQTPFQDAPLDMMTDDFYLSREALIQTRLEALRAGELRWLFEHWEAYHGLVARGISWEAYTLHELTRGASKLGPELLAAMVGHLLEDYRHRRRGLPDLLLWPAADGPQGKAEDFWLEMPYTIPGPVWFAEVKSTRDRLSSEQRAWMGALRELGAQVELCWVESVPH